MNRHTRIDNTSEAEHQRIGVGTIHRGFSLIFPRTQGVRISVVRKSAVQVIKSA